MRRDVVIRTSRLHSVDVKKTREWIVVVNSRGQVIIHRTAQGVDM
jgi:hypothetical protein